MVLQHDVFRRPRALCCMKGPRRHVEERCQLTFWPEVACILAEAIASLQYTADWSAVWNCTLSSYSAARLLKFLLALSTRHSSPTPACRRLALTPAIGGHRIAFLLL